MDTFTESNITVKSEIYIPDCFLNEDEVDQDLLSFDHEFNLSSKVEEAPLEESSESDEEFNVDMMWQIRTGLDLNSLSAVIETIVFMSDKPVSIAKIRNSIDELLPLKIIHEAISKLQSEYEEKHHGLRLLEVAEGYQFRTKATYAKYVQDLFKIKSLVLTPSALEVLAIIAYKQPVSKVEVEKIRGVDSSHIVRQLMDKRLVKTAGRSDDLGRPMTFATTPEFLDVFNLADLGMLPSEHELEDMAQSDVGRIADIKTVCFGDKSKFVFDEFAELEELSSSIKEISPDTTFTKSLKFESKRRLQEDGTKAKSAFDLLEEFVDSREITAQNIMAAESETMLPAIEPIVVKDIANGPHNLPEVEEEFEMVDLDTGEPIIFSEDSLEDQPENVMQELVAEIVEEAEEVITEKAIVEEAEETQILPIKMIPEVDANISESTAENFLFSTDAGVRSADSLEAALDAAFSNLEGFDFNAPLDLDLEIDDNLEKADSKSLDIDEVTQSIIEKGSSLDLDLSFLSDGPSSPQMQ